MNKFKVLYFGTWGYGLAGLKALHESDNVDIIKVFTKWDLSVDNKYLNQVYNYAVERNYFVINSDRSKSSKEQFEKDIIGSGDFDFIVSCCFDRIFTRRILSLPKVMAINVHPSILPSYRGIMPLENAIVKGERFTGITIHQLTEELDAGDILLQDERIEINAGNTFQQLYESQCALISRLLKKFYDDPYKLIKNKTRQDVSMISDAPRLNIIINDDDTVSAIIKKYYNKKPDANIL